MRISNDYVYDEMDPWDQYVMACRDEEHLMAVQEDESRMTMIPIRPVTNDCQPAPTQDEFNADTRQAGA